jgi:hypothetical protein
LNACPLKEKSLSAGLVRIELNYQFGRCCDDLQAGVTKVSPDAVVPSIKVLALKVRFRVAEEVRTLLSFLRCFPEVETLHIMAVSIIAITAFSIACNPSFAELCPLISFSVRQSH